MDKAVDDEAGGPGFNPYILQKILHFLNIFFQTFKAKGQERTWLQALIFDLGMSTHYVGIDLD